MLIKCHTDCAYNQNHECSRHTDHLLQAKCKDRTVMKKQQVYTVNPLTLKA